MYSCYLTERMGPPHAEQVKCLTALCNLFRLKESMHLQNALRLTQNVLQKTTWQKSDMGAL
jgi:hypothetical protein